MLSMEIFQIINDNISIDFSIVVCIDDNWSCVLFQRSFSSEPVKIGMFITCMKLTYLYASILDVYIYIIINNWI